jgi:hypothetical protein
MVATYIYIYIQMITFCSGIYCHAIDYAAGAGRLRVGINVS